MEKRSGGAETRGNRGRRPRTPRRVQETPEASIFLTSAHIQWKVLTYTLRPSRTIRYKDYESGIGGNLRNPPSPFFNLWISVTSTTFERKSSAHFSFSASFTNNGKRYSC